MTNQVQGKHIEFPANGGTARGYLAGSGVKGVIVLQEWWGLVPHIEDVTRRFAAEGFLALAPDLYEGKTTTGPDEAGRLMQALDVERAATAVGGAIAALRAHGAEGKVGVVGFCMGGQLALYTATRFPADVGACVDFYGIHPKVQPDFAKLEAPVLGIFGERDPMVTPDKAEALEQAVRAAGGRFERHMYPADHAFFNDTRKEVYEPTSARNAWDRTVGFFRSNL